MAIWQFRLDLIPTSALHAKFDNIPTSIPQEMAEDFQWWSDVQPQAGLEARVDVILPKADSWSEDLLIWGDERGDKASVCYDKNRKVEWIGFRVDVRKLSLSFISDICRLSNELGCVLLTGTYNLIVPEEQTVLAAISRSTAQRYLEDPVKTLRSLKPSKDEITRPPTKTKENDVPPKDE